jgi:hypothetical protein
MTDPDAAGGGGEYQVVVGKSSHLFFCAAVLLSGPIFSSQPSRSLDSTGLSALATARAQLTTRIRMDKRRSPLPSR